MENEAECCLTHLIDWDGTFNAVGFDNFINQFKLGDGFPYVVVIMGPLGIGKSTLLNHLFHTKFKEMDASRSQTTKGICVCADDRPLAIVMDLEGTDRRERGEDDTAFEKQSALFAFVVSDIVLINDMLRLYRPHKTTLMFVIRDQTKTPLDKLESVLSEDIQKIWESVRKPEVHKLTPLSEFFDVQVHALPSYEDKEEEFKKQVCMRFLWTFCRLLLDCRLLLEMVQTCQFF